MNASLPSWLTLDAKYSAIWENHTLSVWRNDFPEMQQRLTIKADEANPKAIFDANFIAFNQALETHIKTLKALKNDYGIIVERNNRELHLSQPAYGIDFHFPFGNFNSHVDLQKVEDRAFEQYSVWAAKLSTLSEYGCTIEKEPFSETQTRVVITHPSLKKWATFKLKGTQELFDKKGMDTLLQVMNELHIPDLDLTQTWDVAKDAAPIATIPDLQIDKPKQKATLVIDANILKELSAPRGNNTVTWLDLIPLTATLPTVNKIIIPAVIADLELRGLVPEGSLAWNDFCMYYDDEVLRLHDAPFQA